ncbi:MAG: GntR family transcriptional regulator [Actinomycetales bacterium]|nr:GntR family transcriptional regulator [Actinomycetales bacterium]
MSGVKPPTAQEAVLATLRSEIASGDLAPGEQVVQDDLARRYGVSRVPIREALRILEAEGLLEYHAHRGYFVAVLSVEDLAEVYRIRELLEAEALALVVDQIEDDDIADLDGLMREVERATQTQDVSAISAANRAFHFAMLQACGMPRLVRMIRLLWDATDAYRSVYFLEPSSLERVNDEHRQMMAALRDRDAERLIAVQAEHRHRSVVAVTGRIRAMHASSPG